MYPLPTKSKNFVLELRTWNSAGNAPTVFYVLSSYLRGEQLAVVSSYTGCTGSGRGREKIRFSGLATFGSLPTPPDKGHRSFVIAAIIIIGNNYPLPNLGVLHVLTGSHPSGPACLLFLERLILLSLL